MLTTISSVGELERMTQYKDKAQKRTDGIPRITNLPTINGADIVIYNTNIVPVGEDQNNIWN